MEGVMAGESTVRELGTTEGELLTGGVSRDANRRSFPKIYGSTTIAKPMKRDST
jgi:hypothetical protein